MTAPTAPADSRRSASLEAGPYARLAAVYAVFSAFFVHDVQGRTQEHRIELLSPQTQAQAELFARGPACRFEDFERISAAYNFDKELPNHFVENSRWLSHRAVISQVAGGKAELTATGTHISEAWLTWRESLAIERSWLITSHIEVPKAWDSVDTRDAQVGIGMFVGKSSPVFPASSDLRRGQSPTVYEVNLATLAGTARFIQAQMIANRLGGDPEQTAVVETELENLELAILYCAEDRTLSVFYDGIRLDTQAIDVLGAVDWRLSDSAVFDVGIMGFAEHSDLRRHPPTVAKFRIRRRTPKEEPLRQTPYTPHPR